MTRAPAIVVLAAGRGSRFCGRGHKLNQAVGASTVLCTTIGHALATRMDVVVVTTAAFVDAVAGCVARRSVVVVPSADEAPGRFGMGHSIAAGVTATSHAGGWLVLPADMPLVRPATLIAVAQALLHHPVAYAQCRGRRGHPVGFGAELYSELGALRGDQGGKRLSARYPAIGVETNDEGVLIDIDTEADLAHALGLLAHPDLL